MSTIITNFAYGNGPYCRAVDLAIAINKKLLKEGLEEHRILVPLVYGKKQIEILKQDIGNGADGNNILLDEGLGQYLNQLFYAGGDYQKSLEKYAENQPDVEEKMNEYLRGRLAVKTLGGKQVKIDGDDIVMEIAYNPRVKVDVAKSYYTTIAPFSEILEETAESPELGGRPAFKQDTLLAAGEIAQKMEKQYSLHFQSEPFVFSYKRPRGRPLGEIFAPPLIHEPAPNNEDIPDGIYVTVSGIPGLGDTLTEASKLGLKIYGQSQYPPDFISNEHILYHFARSGWSSVFLSHITETPLITPAYKAGDDPEIFFNEKTIEALGLGVVLRGQADVPALLKKADSLIDNYRRINKKLQETYKTLDGIEYTAKIIAEHLDGRKIDRYKNVPPVFQGSV